MPTKAKPPAKTTKTAKPTKAAKAVKAVKTAKPAAKPAAKVVSKPASKVASKAPAQPVKKAAPVKTASAKTTPVKSPPVKTPIAKKAAKTAPPKQVAGAASASDTPATMRGRSVFVVQTTGNGVVVRSAWLAEDKKLLEMPAVFPEVNYALAVIDDLRKQVLDHFSRAAQVGARAIASQRKAAAQKS